MNVEIPAVTARLIDTNAPIGWAHYGVAGTVLLARNERHALRLAAMAGVISWATARASGCGEVGS